MPNGHQWLFIHRYLPSVDNVRREMFCSFFNFRFLLISKCLRQFLIRLYVILQLFFKSKGIVSEEAYILFVRKNAIVVLIPKYGLEGTVFFEEKDKPKPRLIYDDEVQYVYSFHLFVFGRGEVLFL